MTTPAWCAQCCDATEHEPSETVPLSLVCLDCGNVRTDRRAQRAAGRGFLPTPAGTAGPLVHAEWCTDDTLRRSDSILDRSRIRVRCLGCGASAWTDKDEAAAI